MMNSVIRVLDWLPNLLGKFYMYFTHHACTFIRLAKHSLGIFYTWVDDALERIPMAQVGMRRDWLTWQAIAPLEVLRPAATCKGIQYPLSRLLKYWFAHR